MAGQVTFVEPVQQEHTNKAQVNKYHSCYEMIAGRSAGEQYGKREYYQVGIGT